MLKHSEFALIRTPVFSIEDCQLWTTIGSDFGPTLREWLSKPFVRSGLYLASPSLFCRVEAWLNSTEVAPAPKLAVTLLNYYQRMHIRAVPFGLFAGVSTLKICNLTNLIMSPNRQTVCRIDNKSLLELQKLYINESMRVYINPTLYSLSDCYRYIERKSTDSKVTYHLSSVLIDPPLESALNTLREGSTFGSWVKGLLHFGDIKEITAYCTNIIEEGLVLIDLNLRINAPRPDIDIIEQYCKIHDDKFHSELKALRNEIDSPIDFNKLDVKDIKRWESLFSKGALNDGADARLHVDYFHSDVIASISSAEINKVLKAFDDLSNDFSADQESDSLRRFKENFEKRFGCQAVPLLIALDDEIGISYSKFKQRKNMILNSIKIKTKKDAFPPPLSTFSKRLLDKLLIDPSAEEIFIDQSMLKESSGFNKYPASFSLLMSVYKDKSNNAIYKLDSAFGPSGANLIGRFCIQNAELEHEVNTLFERENKMYPECILAEIIHVPQGDFASNVVSRPSFRDYDIPVHSPSNKSPSKQISLQDLFVYIEDSQIKLWSKSHNKQVIPRMTSAHNARFKTLGIYNFLVDLQLQGTKLAKFCIPHSLSNLRYFPRLMYKNFIISPRRWVVSVNELLGAIPGDLRKIFNPFKVPEIVQYQQGDQFIQVSLNDKNLLQRLKLSGNSQETVVFEEVIEKHYQPAVKMEGKSFVNEFVIPVINTEFTFIPSKGPGFLPSPNDFKIKNYNAPFSSWITFNIFGNDDALDYFLIKKFFNKLKEFSSDVRYFYVRYNIPSQHIRLRLNTGTITRVELDKFIDFISCCCLEMNIQYYEVNGYMREVRRYGGEKLMDISEDLFFLDSKMTLNLLSRLDIDDTTRWYIGLASCFEFGRSIFPSIDLLSNLFVHVKSRYGTEFLRDKEFKASFSQFYRNNSTRIAQVLAGTDNQLHQLGAYDLFFERASLSKFQVSEMAKISLYDSNRILDVASSHIHMICNRLFSSFPRRQEFIIYEVINKYLVGLSCRRKIKDHIIQEERKNGV